MLGQLGQLGLAPKPDAEALARESTRKPTAPRAADRRLVRG
jgi:hypothetical protein